MRQKYTVLRAQETLKQFRTDKVLKTAKKSMPYKQRNKSCCVCGNSLLIPSGTCYVCQVCGTSMGCS